MNSAECKEMVAYVDSIEAEMLDFLRDLVRIESPSKHKAGVDAVGQKLKEFCEKELGYNVRFMQHEKYGNCFCACSCAFEDYKNGIVLSGHMDTAQALGSFDPILEEDDEYIYGPGVGDCKSGVTLCLMVALALKKMNYTARPIKLLFNADEEGGGPIGREFYMPELEGTDYMFNAESGIRDSIVTGRKASFVASFSIKGRAGHIGYLTDIPESAIREAVEKISALEKSSDYDNLTFVCSTIKGGHCCTSVAADCEFTVNVRIKDLSYVDKAVEIFNTVANTTYVKGTTTTMEIIGRIMPMSQCEANMDMYEKFNQASKDLGLREYKSIFSGGASDASHASLMNIPVICATGPVVDFQHTRNERVLKSSFTERTKAHVKMIIDYL